MKCPFFTVVSGIAKGALCVLIVVEKICRMRVATVLYNTYVYVSRCVRMWSIAIGPGRL